MTQDMPAASEMPEEIWATTGAEGSHYGFYRWANGGDHISYTRTDFHTATVERLARAEELLTKLGHSFHYLSGWQTKDGGAVVQEIAEEALGFLREYEGKNDAF